MATFDEHIQQSKNNIDYLSKINTHINDRWDWQVTVCFYSALHLINAHIVKTMNKNYLSHKQVDDVLNPYSLLSVGKLDENTYLSYTKLCHLSRRSRYLLNEKYKKEDDIHAATMTFSPHFKKAIYHLDVVLKFINEKYGETFNVTNINCIDLKTSQFNYFKITD